MKQRTLFAVANKKEPKQKVKPVTVKTEQVQCSNMEVYELIRQRRLQMLVHSCMYYRLNTSLITDKQFDTWGRELVKLQNDYPEISRQVEWYKEFKDWDATTGFHLPLTHPWVLSTAQMLLNIEERRKENGIQ